MYVLIHACGGREIPRVYVFKLYNVGCYYTCIYSRRNINILIEMDRRGVASYDSILFFLLFNAQ